ncbi:LysR family transcriptional regulator [Bordetella sp. BOR01]|uniref:LysR family transcriptional regulator n=1 Tax=Bordetella sp. BOR01 TaxID=2854779 RepID=UPI001C4370B4|nr:LysR family transcriptional regulator [Bordetella sp. BOR01]MBV7483849.1 LysR family transcriptional regulator [Bordetella sp. BOR01]
METSEIRLFRVFLVLMDERNVSRAAERLGLSQPAASHLLARLRTWFQDPLLIRSRAGMVPTGRALEVVEIVRNIVLQHDRLMRPAQKFDPATSRRTFVISASEFSERLLMPPLVRYLRQEAPHVKLVIRAPDPERAFEMLENGTLDLRIAWLTEPFTSLRSTMLLHDRLVCLADRRHGDTLTLDQLLTMPMVRTYNYNQTTNRRVIDQALEKQGHKASWTFLVQNFQVIPEMLVGTDLVAVLPRMLARLYADERSLRVYAPPVSLPPVRYAAYWHERYQKDAEHRWLRAALTMAAKGVNR